MSVVTVAPYPSLPAGLFWIPALFFAGILLVQRRKLSLATRRLLLVAMLVCGSMSLSGCGKSVARVGAQTGTPIGTSTVTVTATGTGASSAYASASQTLSVSVNVIAAQ
jgi:hypothetical protein